MKTTLAVTLSRWGLGRTLRPVHLCVWDRSRMETLQGATAGQIEDFVGLSGAAFARCLISLIARFRRLTELACRPLRPNAEAYPISAMARPAAQSWHHRANRMDKLQYIGRSPQGHLRTLDSQ